MECPPMEEKLSTNAQSHKLLESAKVARCEENALDK